MEPKFQTSFIPKAPVTTGSGTNITPIHRTNIFTVLSTMVFIFGLLAAGGVFAYEKYLQTQVDTAATQLNDAKDAFQPEKIQELVDVSSRIASAKQLLGKHVVVSQLFRLLQSLTVSKVRFSNLTYTTNQGVVGVAMSGEAQSYNALAQQSDLFAQNSFLQNPQFSDFKLSDNGNIQFKVSATIDPTLVSYQKAIEALDNNQ